MKRGWVNLLLAVSTIILFITFSSINANAGNAGVGVLNVPPQYSMIRLEHFDNTMRAYLTVSDYNSWEDIFSVSIVLEGTGVEIAEFIFKQYEKETSLYEDKINEFTEELGENLLVTKKCSYNRIDGGETVEEKCNLELLFVFQSTGFDRLKITANDRDGKTATLQLDYTSEDLIRSGSIIIIPGLDKSMVIGIPPYLLDLIALFIAGVGTWYVVRKTDIGKIMRTIYEKN